jgi:hypothetical protein
VSVTYYWQILVNIVDAIIKGHYKSLTMKNEKSYNADKFLDWVAQTSIKVKSHAN